MTDDTIATLNAVHGISGQIVIDGEMSASQILDLDSEMDERNDSMMTSHTHVMAEPLTIVTDNEGNKQIALMTQDGQMLSGVIMDSEHLSALIKEEREINTSEQPSEIN